MNAEETPYGDPGPLLSPAEEALADAEYVRLHAKPVADAAAVAQDAPNLLLRCVGCDARFAQTQGHWFGLDAHGKRLPTGYCNSCYQRLRTHT